MDQNQQTEQQQIEQAAKDKKQKRTIYFTYFAVILGLITVVSFCLYFFYFRIYKYTDDAYVHGNLIQINSQVAGTINAVCVEETDFVQKDQILIELDPTDYIIRLEKAKSTLANAVRDVSMQFQKYDALQAQLKEAEAHLELAQVDFDNRAPLVDTGAIAKEEMEHVTLKLQSAKAALEKVWFTLRAQEAYIGDTTVDTHPIVVEAKDGLRQAWIDLKRTRIVAPTSGYVGMRRAQLGESVVPNTPLLSVVPLEELWVDANFKETQLSRMRIGQKVKIYSDIYGGSVLYTGDLVGVNPGTGNVFSILPPQNATGNWIKIVQRVPVRISLDPDSVKQHPLVPGMSMYVTVDTSDQSGDTLATVPRSKPLYTTRVYEQQELGVQEIIRDIVRENNVLLCGCTKNTY